MSLLRIEFDAGSLHLPELGLWLDPREPQTGPEKVFVSHAHSDHIAAHREVILSAPTARLMQARLAGARREHVLTFEEPTRFEHGGRAFQLTLLPAGHIFGSAMSLVEAEGRSLLYTGDFKLRRGLSAEPCAPRPADILVMETTYGRPQYIFPPAEAVLKGVTRFCREALDHEETPVLLGYSLGKSQELLCGLAEAGLPLMVHGTIYKLTQIYEQFGQRFPAYDRYAAGSARGKVLLCPPHAGHAALVRNLGKTRTAILTGWAIDPNCRFRYGCDVAFPLSDHADFSELIGLVERVQPEKIYTLHGFAREFAQTLRERGYDAQALGQEEQFALALEEGTSGERQVTGQAGGGPPGGRRMSKAASAPSPASATRTGNAPASAERVAPDGPPHAEVESAAKRASSPPGDSFADFALTCARIAADRRKLQKVRLLAEYLRGLKGEAVALAATWLSGRPFPASQNKVLQLGWAVLRDALCAAGEVDTAAFYQVYLQHSDLGETAAEILQRRQVVSSLSMAQAGELFEKLHGARGPLAKTPLLTAALEKCTPLEAKFLVKIITGDLRIGLKEGLVEEAVATAFAKEPEAVRQADLLVGDIGETAKLAAEDRLGEATLVPFRPVKFMLASPEPTAAAVWERVQSWASSLPAAIANAAQVLPPKRAAVENPSPGEEPTTGRQEACPAVWLEDKYDGVRCQLHKAGRRVALYSRDLKEITSTFLEVADAARGLAADFILDGELLAMRGEQVLPFAELQRRLGRRQGDLFLREEVPIQFVAFDLLWLDEASCLARPLRERRRALEGLALPPEGFRLARITQAGSAEEIDAAFAAARARGNEGLMIKDPASVYAPGRRGLAWLKLKKAFATLDCVVVGAEYGHGKRRQVLSDYTFAVRDERTGELKTIGKAYSGLTDQEIARLTQHFLQTAVRQQGRYFEVRPDTVLEIAFDKIQPSARHSSGLALRFPRIVRIRTDKSVAEIDTVATARRLVAPPEAKLESR